MSPSSSFSEASPIIPSAKSNVVLRTNHSKAVIRELLSMAALLEDAF
jgi:hypothetical protein